MSKSFVICFALGMVLLGIGAGASRQKPQEVERADATVSTVPDAPMTLAIPGAKNAAADDFEIELQVLITNVSDKEVSAYTIRHDLVRNGTSRPVGWSFSQCSTAKSIVRPGDTRSVTIGGGARLFIACRGHCSFVGLRRIHGWYYLGARYDFI